MPRIYVQFSGLDQVGTGCKTVASKVDTIETEFWRTIQALDWDVRFSDNINSTAKHISRKLEQQTKILKDYQQFIESAYKMYTELDAVDFELKIMAGRNNIFNSSNGYGGDQGDMANSKNGAKLFGWVLGEDKGIYDFVKQQKGYENYSEADIHNLLKQINQEGCGYVALVNTLFWEFQGTEAEFEEMYGFSMRDENGNYNFNRMLIDIYCKTDDKYFLMEDSGKSALVTAVLRDYQDNPDKFEQDYGVTYNPSSNTVSDDVVNAILSQYDEDIATYKSGGTDNFSQENRLLAYLHEKGIDADVSCTSESTMSIDGVRTSLDSGTVVKLSLSKGAQLCDEHGKIQQTLSGGHAVLITEITDDGRYVISSWGNKYYVDPQQMYTDAKTGKNESVINSYLSININYR
ncbi:MAG: hypothetical protein IKA09_12845 [Lachnospiraceae bacterium]|nr:hypothetical protein [Lachnospiraceae bacterium]